MSEAVAELLALLDLEYIEHNLYRGQSPTDSWQRVFGGQVLGQALVAATRTVEEGLSHSLHAYFLRPGDPKVPIVYEVDRIRDGRSFTTRRVVAIQHGRAIFAMEVSFHKDEPGFAHQIPMPPVPAPEDVPSEAERRLAIADRVPEPHRLWFLKPRPIELRPVSPHDHFAPEKRPPISHWWCRATARLPDDPGLQRCVLAYASDMTLLDTSLNPHGVAWLDPRMQTASLDHAMWFHRPFRADDWLLYTMDSPAAFGARGFNRGAFYTRDGVLVASVAQEGLIRFTGDLPA